MKQEYTELEAEVILFESVDVITTSDDTTLPEVGGTTQGAVGVSIF